MGERYSSKEIMYVTFVCAFRVRYTGMPMETAMWRCFLRMGEVHHYTARADFAEDRIVGRQT